MITLDEVTAGYGERMIVHGITWHLQRGKVHGLAGLNGSGKTTLLRVLAGLLKPASGHADWSSIPQGRIGVGFLETESYFYPHLTAEEYLKLLACHKPFDFSGWLELFRIPANGLIDEFSTGMKRKLAFTGMVALQREVLLLDEPFNGLDMESAYILGKVLGRMRDAGRTLVVTSHLLSTLLPLCDQLVLLCDGKLHRQFDAHDAPEIEKELFHELESELQAKLDRLPGIKQP